MSIRTRRPLHRLALTIGALTLSSLALSGCTGDSKPVANGSGTSPHQSPMSSAATLKDRSAEVMAALAEPTVIASAKAKVSDAGVEGSTLRVHSLVRTQTSTVLNFSLISTTTTVGLSPGLWERFPVLTTPAAAYHPVTWLKEPGSQSPWYAVYNPTMWPHADLATPPQSILYPPLPTDVTTVTLTSTWFEDVTVPVTAGP